MVTDLHIKFKQIM